MSNYVKLDDVINVIEGIAFGRTDDNDYAICELMRIPAADVRENVHGRWIHHEYDWAGDYWECSNCHEEYGVIDGDMDADFCPRCGVDMRKVKTDEQP